MATTQQQVQHVIDEHLNEFELPGVLSVRAGFRMRDGWITGERAVVVTVAPVRPAGTSAVTTLPTEVGGVPVDVRTASSAKAAQLTGVSTRTAGGEQRRLAPDQGAVPVFPTEHAIASDQHATYEAVAATGAGAATVTGHPLQTDAAATKERIDYTAPSGEPLQPVSGDIQLELSASPDAGWPVLAQFLSGTQKTLTVGLYDFTSAHVLTRFEQAAAGKGVVFVLDHPAKNPTADQTDDDTVAALRSSLGTGFDQAWALERADPHAAAWIYPSAYHIKVAVRDSSAVWLSSGNWNNSNQPDIDPVHVPADAAEARTRDRDWHVVIHDETLANVFEAYLKHDHTVASQHQAASPASAALDAVQLVQPLVQTPPFKNFTAPETLTDHMTITPVLTPDPGVYADAVRSLIESATASLHLQFQYIEPPSTKTAASAGFSALIDAVIARQNAGVEVHIIMSQYETAGYLEQLQQLGLDVVHNVKLQNNVHNKGIVVDGARTLVSSQNWSTAGTLQNRDAGVIIDSARVAAYFDAIFQHDWENLARQQAHED
ncbi:phospholipase D-like domain-containing protein [Rathayibacter sp. KR2-224]|uniref:phospholipase D-like domain-containing protein n=1 Tax=Rathayibacter sp. KR2-224 TaxID=3400913 RepID=UPI003C07E77B